MISFPGREEVIRRVYDHGQERIFDFWNEISDSEKLRLLDDVESIDFTLLERLFRQAEQGSPPPMGFEPAPYIPLAGEEEGGAEFREARERGRELISEGAVAAFVVAGGQGSRLGFDGPKGLFSAGPVSGKSLFQIHAEQIRKSSEKFGVRIPWLIMTSHSNHDQTVRFLEDNSRFGLDAADVYVFPQGMIPSLDLEGKLILETPSSIFKNPDGHGGSLGALAGSGTLHAMREHGIRIISYFQVDNPLVSIIDPLFIGFHSLRKADISSKGLMKAYPEERIGVFVRFDNGAIGVVEYSDLPEELQKQRDERGRLRYRMGSIAIHLFGVDYLESITGGTDLSLPFHAARKKIGSHTANGIREIDGYKFEKFVFDALPLTERNIVLETKREEEFAPIKNPSGVDSVESAQGLMDARARRWLRERGIDVPPSTAVVEISPLLALEPGDIPASLRVPDRKRVNLEPDKD
ncbi:MAG TPA: UDPGP type 1 family protein [Spirochaetota bacterium]|nr:UDPGP type 1 family protein [Spirochaetota bacterium]